MTAPPLVGIRDLTVKYALQGSSIGRIFGRTAGSITAVDRITLDLARGEALGLVGESGSGKSTVGRALLGLAPVSGGRITVSGTDITGRPEKALRPLRRTMQMVFQDPHASLNPSMTIGRAIGDALRIHGLRSDDRPQAVAAALDRVGLSPASVFAAKYPGELSGGQQQRAVIARAICLGPELLVADEPISMLDMSVRAKILGLLTELRAELGLSYLYITHDLASARLFCDRVAIMYLGRIVEIGPTEEIFTRPRHPYTQALLAAVAQPDPSRQLRSEPPRGDIPDAANPPAGCSFHPRCPMAFDRCGWEGRDLQGLAEQRWTKVDGGTFAAESARFGDLRAVRTVDGRAVITPASGSPEQLAVTLSEIRQDDPDDIFWSGVRSVEPTADGVELRFTDSAVPELLPLIELGRPIGVDVACHRYH